MRSDLPIIEGGGEAVLEIIHNTTKKCRSGGGRGGWHLGILLGILIVRFSSSENRLSSGLEMPVYVKALEKHTTGPLTQERKPHEKFSVGFPEET